MDTYISKTGKLYPVFRHSVLDNEIKACIAKHLSVLDKGARQSRMRAIDTDRTLYSCYADDSKKILLFIEVNGNKEITERFAVDTTK